MKVLFATPEAHPLIKTGGLADVSGALPKALKNLRHDVRILLPAYRSVVNQAENIAVVSTLMLDSMQEPVRILETRLPGSQVKAYLVDAPEYFDREGNPYVGPDGHDWPDNAQRFALFCRAIVEIAQDRAGLDWRPDLVHCNDWQTGLVPALLNLETTRPATLFTIHNLAYQGLFDWDTFAALNLPKTWWHFDGVEFHGRLSFIKGGLVFADHITTVSPTYAREILTPEFGYGLEGLLTHRQDRLHGILNGVDYKIWSPNQDPYLEHHFNGRSLAGKAQMKAALQKEFKLTVKDDIPLLAHIGRLVDQKGVDLILDCLPHIMSKRAQLIILGSGQAQLEEALRKASQRYPKQLGIRIGYDEALSHRIEAGADMFLMPSRFEPCGLNQIYSLRYATLPIVRRTGGLADSVIDATDKTLSDGTATGIQFESADSQSLCAAVDRACQLFRKLPVWKRVITQGMRQDFSWKKSAQQYVALYEQAIAERTH